jgi:hypothetical protein
MADRFDLEEKIMRASWVLEDIRLMRDRHNQIDFTWDEVDNFLMSMETIYQNRFDDLDDMMCQVFELNQYASKKHKEKRAPIFDVNRHQPIMTDQERKVVDEFVEKVERDKKWKPTQNLQSTFDEKM